MRCKVLNSKVRSYIVLIPLFPSYVALGNLHNFFHPIDFYEISVMFLPFIAFYDQILSHVIVVKNHRILVMEKELDSDPGTGVWSSGTFSNSFAQLHLSFVVSKLS